MVFNEPLYNQLHEKIIKFKPDNDGLNNGNTLLMLYHGLRYRVFGKPNDHDRCEEYFNKVIFNLNKGKSRFDSISLSNGLSGFLFVARYLSRDNMLNVDGTTGISFLDEYLFETSVSQIKEDRLDFLHKSGGALLYFSKNFMKHAREYCDELISSIYQRAIDDYEGLRFNSVIEDTGAETYYNLSLSHGLAGLLLLLVESYDLSGKKDLIVQMLIRGASYLKSKYDDVNLKAISRLPSMINKTNGERVFIDRLAWCYGDLGIVLILYRAFKIVNDPALQELADIVGLACSKRVSVSDTLVKEPTLCHGSSGVSLFYHTLAREKSMLEYSNAADYWLNVTYKYLQDDNMETFSPNLYNGSVGIALFMLEVFAGENLGWSKLLLL